MSPRNLRPWHGIGALFASLLVLIQAPSARSDDLPLIMNTVFCPEGGKDSYCLRAHLWSSQQVNLYMITDAPAGDPVVADMAFRYQRMERENLLNVVACALDGDGNSAGLALQSCPSSDDIILFLKAKSSAFISQVFDTAAAAIDRLSQASQPGIAVGRQRMLANMRSASQEHHCLYQGGGDAGGNIKFIILVNLESTATADAKAGIACNTLLFSRSIGASNIDFEKAMKLELKPELRLDRILYLSGIASGQSWSNAERKIGAYLQP
jgi:hypothetical protein